jgi:hypothetical protein
MTRGRLDVLIVAGEPCWPAANGGRVRTGGVALALSRDFEVAVAAPPDPSELDTHFGEPPLPTIGLPPRETASVRHSSSLAPRLGRAVLGREAVSALAKLFDRTRPRVVLFGMSYLAAVSPWPVGSEVVVDFANLEVNRLRSLASGGPPKQRVSASLEALKALRWEPRVARTSDLSLAVHGADAERLERWGARTLLVPNTASRPSSYVPSPREPLAVFVASGAYRPNVSAGRTLVEDVWPLVRRRIPSARLQIVGHRTASVFDWAVGRPGIEVVGTVPDMDGILRGAAVVVAPVQQGAGTQLKILEALAAGRVVVVTEYGARSVPAPLTEAAVVASSPGDFAARVADLFEDGVDRHRREHHAWEQGIPTWEETTASLAAYLAGLRPAAVVAK